MPPIVPMTKPPRPSKPPKDEPMMDADSPKVMAVPVLMIAVMIKVTSSSSKPSNRVMTTTNSRRWRAISASMAKAFITVAPFQTAGAAKGTAT